MAVIDHDHISLSTQSPAASDHTKLDGLICGVSFLAFWIAFLAGVWGLHALVDKLF